jgi:signal transduction histidine kinase
MSLQLPPHLAPRSITRSFARALHAVGFTCLGAALVLTLAFQVAYPQDVLWPAMLALVPMGFLLWLDNRGRSFFISASFLAVGAIGVFVFVLTYYNQPHPIVASDAFAPAIVKIPLVIVAGVGSGLLPRVAWCVAGYITAGVASAAAMLVSGATFTFDVPTMLAVVLLIVIFVLANESRRKTRRSQPLLYRAARDEELAALRYRIEVRAAALMHDTVLSHLAAVAGAPPGSDLGNLRATIEHDLDLLVDQEWLRDERFDAIDSHLLDWQESALYAAIQEAEAMGLQVETTGDFAVILRLDREQSLALGLAVKQCLVNVLRHAGTDRAEVAIDGSPDEVTVMVVDAGRGFSEAETGTDRLGLKQSVRRRVEAIGGAVQVWSTPGRGTSIILRIPTVGADQVAVLRGDSVD